MTEEIRNECIEAISTMQDILHFIYDNSTTDLDCSDLSFTISDINNYLDNNFDCWEDNSYITYINSLTNMIKNYMHYLIEKGSTLSGFTTKKYYNLTDTEVSQIEYCERKIKEQKEDIKKSLDINYNIAKFGEYIRKKETKIIEYQTIIKYIKTKEID